jgi:hypothetical protein
LVGPDRQEPPFGEFALSDGEADSAVDEDLGRFAGFDAEFGGGIEQVDALEGAVDTEGLGELAGAGEECAPW